MNFSCTKEKLAEAASIAERFTGKNITLPVLGNVLLEFDANMLTLTATNLEHAVQLTVKGEGSGNWSITLPARIFTQTLQSIREDTVRLEGGHDGVLVKTKTRETRVQGVSPQDFPLIPKVKKLKEFTLSMRESGMGIQMVLPAVSQSEFKPELTGVLWRVTPSSLRLVATDTFRLAEKTLPLAKHQAESFTFILPARSAAEIARVFERDGDAIVLLDDNQVEFGCGEIRIISRLIDGKFPDYDAVIPKQHETICIISRQDVCDAIKGSSIFASKLQDISFNFQEKSVEINSANQEVGEFKTKTAADVQGKNLKINFNYRYVLDGLNMLRGDEVFWGCNTEQSPVLLRNTKDGSLVYVVMPIRAM